MKIGKKKTDFQLLPFSTGMNPGTTKQIIIGEYEDMLNETADSLYQNNHTVYFLINSKNSNWELNKPVNIKNILLTFNLRLFDNENVIIKYDYKTNKYKINKDKHKNKTAL